MSHSDQPREASNLQHILTFVGIMVVVGLIFYLRNNSEGRYRLDARSNIVPVRLISSYMSPQIW